MTNKSNIRMLTEVDIIQDGNCYTSVKIDPNDIIAVEKGKWDDAEQDWRARIVLKNGLKYETTQGYKKLVAIEKL